MLTTPLMDVGQGSNSTLFKYKEGGSQQASALSATGPNNRS